MIPAEDYTATIVARDLNTVVSTVRFSDLGWGRVLDDLSEATVTIPDKLYGRPCEAALSEELEPWRYGLLIERNAQRVWRGPITDITRPPGVDALTITANDKMAWTKKRRLYGSDLEFEGVDSGRAFRRLVERAVGVDNVFGLYCPTVITGHVIYRNVVALDFEWIFDVLAELAQASIDFTVVDDKLVLRHPGVAWYWAPVPQGSTELIEGGGDPLSFGPFTDEAFAERPGYQKNGWEQGNDIVVPGADSGEAGFRRYWQQTNGGADPRDGVLSYVDVNALYRPQPGTPISTAGIFQQRANALYAMRKYAPQVTMGTALTRQAPVEINQLVPGSVWGIDITESKIPALRAKLQRLARVDVKVTVGDDGVSEEIVPTLIPIGSD